ncbi:MAG: bifunctional phosphoglucose/phosphomannose isomerase, partial [Chloroflexi bacterium]|nr:bifunctional phosphoglucose/phosphomannose isomerase [Chloroflexota bacterium]
LNRGCPAIAVTRGGKVEELARQHKAPVFPIGIECQPRAALGYSLFPLLAFLQRLGLGPERGKAVGEAIEQMRGMASLLAPATPTSQNPAKQLAAAIGERVAVAYGAEHLAAVARRWKTQINENAKSWAFAEALPEQNHNAIEGFNFPAPWDRMFVVLLRGSGYNSRVAQRIGLTQQALSRARVPHQVLDARGDDRLAQAMTMALLGDWVSYYLAIGRGVDPTPVPTLEWLKGQMGKG